MVHHTCFQNQNLKIQNFILFFVSEGVEEGRARAEDWRPGEEPGRPDKRGVQPAAEAQGRREGDGCGVCERAVDEAQGPGCREGQVRLLGLRPRDERARVAAGGHGRDV